MTTKIPKGWEYDKLGNFCSSIRGVSYKPENLKSTKSKQTVGNIIVPKFSTILHQIANGTQGKGNAREVLNRFFEYCSGNVYLTVRQDNLTANKFYVNMGMILIGETMWANGTLPGYVYVRNKFNRLSI